MTIEGVVIIIVGFSASVFLLSFAWWLWTRAPMLPPAPSAQPSTPVTPPAESRWMGWAQPGAPPPPPSPERRLFEQSTLEPINELTANYEGEIDKAKTMFFFKKDPEKTQILRDEDEPDEDAPIAAIDQIQTAARPRAKPTAKRRRPPPPPPPRR